MDANPALTPGQPVGAALRDIAAAMVAQAQAIVDDEAGDPTKTVHAIRRSFKHWRALLRLLAPFVGDSGHELRITARDLARRLSGARDAQAMIDAFQDAIEGNDDQTTALSARTIATIQGRLIALRSANEQTIWNEAIRRELSDCLISASEQITRWHLDNLTFSDLAKMLAKTYRNARRAIPDSWEGIDAEELHELRRRVVEHRYQMELIEPAWPRLGRIWVDEAQRLRTRLGKYQDLAVLAENTGLHRPLAHWRAKLVPIIAQRQADHARAARRMAARMFAESPKAFRRRIEALWEARSDAADEPAIESSAQCVTL